MEDRGKRVMVSPLGVMEGHLANSNVEERKEKCAHSTLQNQVRVNSGESHAASAHVLLKVLHAQTPKKRLVRVVEWLLVLHFKK